RRIASREIEKNSAISADRLSLSSLRPRRATKMRRRVLRSSRRVGRTFSTAMLIRSLLRARDGRMGTIPLDVLGPDPLQLRIGEVGEDVPGDREALVDRA